MPRSVMEHSFAQVPQAEIPRSSFDRSSGYKSTFDVDYLIPIWVDDVVPGDTFNVNVNFFARLATPLYPIMDSLFLETFAFFVPYRLLWENWKKMHGEQEDPADSIDFTVPQITQHTPALGSLSDYFGLPNVAIDVSALPFRAYNLIWNDWFRDENLQDSIEVWQLDGPRAVGNYVLKKRGKRKDYFTGALPWPQKGDAVQMSLGTSAPIAQTGGGNLTNIYVQDELGASTERFLNAASTYLRTTSDAASGTVNLHADLAGAIGPTINDLRLAIQTQRLLERDARGGTRYNELILAHFGVTVPDFRVQRPEFLGGGSTIINVTPVAQTSGQPVPASNDKLGELGGFGTASGTHGFTKSFVEHGVVIILANVRGDITYSQGIERYWSKETRYDFFYPVLAQIGEQSILNKEIWADGSANDDLVFGYTERYNEYRYKPSRLTGLMRPDAAGTLAAWHLSEDFASLPTLGNTFIQSNTGVPLDRAIAIPSEPHVIFDSFINAQCARPMPLYGVPGNLDHF